jgi:serine protease Do
MFKALSDFVPADAWRAGRSFTSQLLTPTLSFFVSALVWFALFAVLFGLAHAANPVASGDEVYAAAKPRLVQIRTLVNRSGNQSSIGSGFAVSADGLAITNYHVVSQYALEPETYRLESWGTDGVRSKVQLLAIDVINDLAIIKLEKPPASFFEFSSRALAADLASGLQKGERIFAMGNPLDLGFTIVEGIYNSLVAKSYQQRIHFSGALNPGMSGGPTVDSAGQVVGVNVAKRLDGEMVSFLVPARYAANLLAKAKAAAPIDSSKARTEITRQLTELQGQFIKDYNATLDKSQRLGSFLIRESSADWITCWANTNAEAKPKPRYSSNGNRCDSNANVFLSGDLSSGGFGYSHFHFANEKLNALQFSKIMRSNNSMGYGRAKRYTGTNCQQSFVEAGAGVKRRVTLCARAYRDLPDLYDIQVSVITQPDSREALVSEMHSEGLQWPNALKLVGEFVSSIKVEKTP